MVLGDSTGGEELGTGAAGAGVTRVTRSRLVTLSLPHSRFYVMDLNLVQ